MTGVQTCALPISPFLSLSQDVIVISGYERNAEEARASIQRLVAELQELVSQDVRLDPRTHARIIGARGKAIRKLMEEFKVAVCVCVGVLCMLSVCSDAKLVGISRVQAEG